MAHGRRSLREPLNSQPRIVQLSATLCGAFSCLHHTPSIFGDQKALASLARAVQGFTVLTESGLLRLGHGCIASWPLLDTFLI